MIRDAENWLQNNVTMYRGDNASDCMIAAFIAGAEKLKDIKDKLHILCRAVDRIEVIGQFDGMDYDLISDLLIARDDVVKSLR